MHFHTLCTPSYTGPALRACVCNPASLLDRPEPPVPHIEYGTLVHWYSNLKHIMRFTPRPIEYSIVFNSKDRIALYLQSPVIMVLENPVPGYSNLSLAPSPIAYFIVFNCRLVYDVVTIQSRVPGTQPGRTDKYFPGSGMTLPWIRAFSCCNPTIRSPEQRVHSC